ncbi:NAD(P)-dependent oxidoreductase [Clostridium sp. AN503]|uniref:NAD(P)-dependent oxidoreductase n=1 Tax=Clostridium sp. AN503 TaxID=3160598 RepID=UPI0034585FCB
MKIVLLESLGVRDELMAEYVKPLTEKGHIFEQYQRDMDPEKQKERLKDADVLMIANMPLKQEVLEACEQLRFIDVAFTGVDHIPVAYAKEHHIAVSNASGYSNDSVAELILGMAISLLRKVPTVDASTRNGKTIGTDIGHELKGKTVGIIGTGAIGSRVAELFLCFGCRVLGYDVYPKELPGVENVELEELLNQSDIVTLHCPMIESTRGLINETTISMMKEGAVLLNASRGPVVDLAALSAALKAGKLSGAGVDVYEIEPPLPQDHPILSAPNTILTPHIAYLSAESMEKRAKIVFDSLNAWLRGEQINKIV